jgi:hypothetical protein
MLGRSVCTYMKSLLVSAVFVFALITGLRAQTNAPASTTTVKTDAPKSDAANETAKVAEPYPVTAIVVSNTITFPVLLSSKSEPLMTNAVYHRTFGRKVIFAADLQLKSFDIDKLHPSVIAQLDLDTNKVKSDQDALDKQNQEWAAQRQAQNQQLLSAEAAALAKSQAAAQAAEPSSTNGAPGTPANGKPHHKKPATPPPAN